MFLQNRMAQWLACRSGQRGMFYTNITFLFLKKYGWETQDNENDDPDDSDMATIRQELAEGDEDEQVQHLDIYTLLRKVSLQNVTLSPSDFR